mgnify:CR=1 FL=1
MTITVTLVSRGICRIAVRDMTPPPTKDLPSDDARLEAAGLDPSGRPINFGKGM